VTPDDAVTVLAAFVLMIDSFGWTNVGYVAFEFNPDADDNLMSQTQAVSTVYQNHGFSSSLLLNGDDSHANPVTIRGQGQGGPPSTQVYKYYSMGFTAHVLAAPWQSAEFTGRKTGTGSGNVDPIAAFMDYSAGEGFFSNGHSFLTLRNPIWGSTKSTYDFPIAFMSVTPGLWNEKVEACKGVSDNGPDIVSNLFCPEWMNDDPLEDTSIGYLHDTIYTLTTALNLMIRDRPIKNPFDDGNFVRERFNAVVIPWPDADLFPSAAWCDAAEKIITGSDISFENGDARYPYKGRKKSHVWIQVMRGSDEDGTDNTTKKWVKAGSYDYDKDVVRQHALTVREGRHSDNTEVVPGQISVTFDTNMIYPGGSATNLGSPLNCISGQTVPTDPEYRPQVCGDCPEGKVLNRDKEICEGCPAGQYLYAESTITYMYNGDRPIEGACADCPPGKSSQDGWKECAPVDFDKYQPLWGQSSDDNQGCPTFSKTNNNGEASIMSCNCLVNYYHSAHIVTDEVKRYTMGLDPPYTAFTCGKCPMGAICNGGIETAYPNPGYWMRCGHPEKCDPVECPVAAACISDPSPNISCADGYKGAVCGACGGTYASDMAIPYKCDDCETAFGSLIVLIPLLCIISFEVVIGLLTTFTIDQLSKTKYNSGKLLFIKIVINHSVETCMLLYIGLKLWRLNDTMMEYVVSHLSGISVYWMMTFQQICAMEGRDRDNQLYNVFWQHITFFSIAMVLPVLVACLFHKRKQAQAPGGVIDRKPTINFGYVWVLWTLYLCLPFVVMLIVRGLACLSIDGVSYLVADTTIVCESSEHLKLVALSTPSVIFFFCLVPSIVAYLMWSHREQIPNHDLAWWGHQRYGLLFFGYSKEYWWWEAVVQARKMTLIVLINLFVAQGPVLQSLTALLLNMAALLAEVLLKPCDSVICGRVESTSKTCASLILISALYMQGEPGPGPTFNVILNLVIFVCLLGPLLMFFHEGYYLFHLRSEEPEIQTSGRDPYAGEIPGKRMRQHRAEAALEIQRDTVKDDLAEKRQVTRWLSDSASSMIGPKGDTRDHQVVIEMQESHEIVTVPNVTDTIDEHLPSPAQTSSPPTTPKRRKKKKKAAAAEAGLEAAFVVPTMGITGDANGGVLRL